MFTNRVTARDVDRPFMPALTALCVGVAGMVAVGSASGAETFAEAIEESEFLFNLRLRYEGVDQVGFVEEADPLTTRLRAGVQTGKWGGTSLLAEAVGVTAVSGDYNSTVNGDTQYPVVADPDDVITLNRFAITNTSLEKTTLTFGRQRIIHDDARFVGNVGWRQFEQTFDGVRAVINASDSVKVDLSYSSQVNRIFGPDSPVGKFNGDIMLANISKSFDFGTLTGFLYGVELDEAAGLSTNTVGATLSGAKAFDSITGIYTLGFARQTDAGNNPTDLSDSWFKVEGGLRFGKATVAAGLEQLGGNGVSAVTMPLATLHAFQGWADKFLGTPAAGIDDTYARFAWQAGAAGPFTGITFVAFYHQFDSDFGSTSYGDELDFSLVARTQSAVFTLKYAAYDADQAFTDTDKIWLSMDYSF